MFLTRCRRLLLKFDSENKFIHIYSYKTLKNKYDAEIHHQQVVFDINNLDKIKAFIKNRKLGVIYEAEEFYTRILILPRISRGALDSVVKNELSQFFSNAGDFSYTFEVLEAGRHEMKVLVYCINSDKTTLLEKCLNNNIIRGIYLIQSCFLVFFKKYIRHERYICIFTYNLHLYLVGCSSGKMKCNYIVKNFDGNETVLMDKLKNILEKFSEGNPRCSGEDIFHVYIANFPYNDLYENLVKNYECTYLGILQNSKLLKTFL